mmetsp:Transcript_8672/g.12199  ORF Transcript_8672/g.12199 Transcript_8672/m.12199 type:complete len:127 (+) Transcript_8672:45-425(+)
MSSWFGGGSSSSSSTDTSFDSGSDFSSGDSAFGTDFASAPAPPSYGGMSGGAGGSEAALRMALQQEQQKAVVQAAISKLTELCWDTCVGRPDAKLSSSEQSCIANCAERYLDTSMFVMGRLTKQQR